MKAGKRTAALTIAGSDPTGGAGLQADLRTFDAHGVIGSSAVTAITVQTSRGVSEVRPVDADLVAAQIDAAMTEHRPRAIKIGMLATGAIAREVASALERYRRTPVVLDTVMLASTGQQLLDAEGIDVLRRRLLPLATVVTPNSYEAGILSGRTIQSLDDQRWAARELVRLGARAAIIKGGHVLDPPGVSIDVLFDGRRMTELRARRVRVGRTHGTGCTFASAIAARLAKGDTLVNAARAAKRYVRKAVLHS